MSSTYFTTTGSRIEVAEKLGEGAEGKIYAILGDLLSVAKIYIKSPSSEGRRKIELMVQNPPEDPSYIDQKHHSIAWPTTLLYSDSGRTACAGFLMPRIDLNRFCKALQYIQPKDRTTLFGGAFSWEHLFNSAYNITSAVAAIHQRGYCIGDLNESNILIASNALITLIDCDSFQVKDRTSGRVYRCPVGKAEYSAPEMAGKFRDTDRTTATDCFALGVILFQLLMEGTHPFQAKGRLVQDAGSTAEKIQRGHFPYFSRNSDIAPPDHAPPFDILHPGVQNLFERCFVKGHRDPQSRPSAYEWFMVLKALRTKFQRCPANSNHRFLSHLAECPWCKLARRGRDPFPLAVGHQIPFDDPSVMLNSVEKRLESLRSSVEMALVDGPLTEQEESRIAETGEKLQIPPKEVKKLIEQEVKRAKLGTGSPPQIEISQRQFDFSNLRVGQNATGSFTISNTGGGFLQGPVVSQNSWLHVHQKSIDAGKHRQDITFSVQTAGLPLGLKENGTIKIQSNAGTHMVQVNLSTELPEIAISRWTKQLHWLGLIAGGAAGYAIRSVIADNDLYAATSLVTALGALLAILCKVFLNGKFIWFIAALVGLFALDKWFPDVISLAAGAALGAILLDLSARKLFVRKQVRGLAGVGGATALGAVVTVTVLLFSATYLVPKLKASEGGNFLLDGLIPRRSISLNGAFSLGSTERDDGRPCKVWKPDMRPDESVKWTGDCANGYANGPGIAIWSRDGQEIFRYQGTFRSGFLHGRGKMIAAGGDGYQGEYRNGKREGHGIYTTASGQRYEGEYYDNKKHGVGVITEADGTRRQARFVQGKQVE